MGAKARRGFSLVGLLMLATSVVGQSDQSAPAQPAAVPKRLAFEVVSIRPSKPGTRIRIMPRATPDGYRAIGQTMLTTLRLAYFPGDSASWWSRGKISGAPAWLSEQYDIDAKVSDADLSVWQKQGSTLDKKPMLLDMLKAMLADRCHLVAHMVPGPPDSGWALELGKHVPRLTESKPDEERPVGSGLPDGGVMIPYQPGVTTPRLTIQGGTMADLAYALSWFVGEPVQDHTGLTGHYDLVVYWIPYPNDKNPEVAHKQPNDPDPLLRWDLEDIGLRYVPIKIPADALVIDHIEQPSEN